MENKRGNVGFIIFFFIVIAVLMAIGLFLIIGSSAINYTFDILVPEISGIGVIGSTNMTDVSSYSMTPLNSVVQSLTWLVGVAYLIAILGVFGMAMIFRITAHRWLIPLFFVLAFMLIIMSIFMSNIYQDISQGNDTTITPIIQEHTLMDFLLINSPLIFAGIIFISGIIMFSGIQQEEFV